MQITTTITAAAATATTTTTFTTLSSSNSISPLSLLPKLSTLSLFPHHNHRPATLIRMGGGPRTYPGGVSKWQWKRMQAKKSKQLLKARLSRERQIYEMRKRAELKAAVSNLERPWEVVSERPLSLFAVSADEQLKVLADRFVKPGGFDLWSENDGPQVFWGGGEGLPSGRFFPEGAVHSVKPYGGLIDGELGSSRIGRVLEGGDNGGRLRVGGGEGRKRGGKFNGGDGDGNGGGDEMIGNEVRGRNLERTRMRRNFDGGNENFNGGDDNDGSDKMKVDGIRGRNLGRTRVRRNFNSGDGNGGSDEIHGRNLGRTRMGKNFNGGDGIGGSDEMERNGMRGRNLGRTRMSRHLSGGDGNGGSDIREGNEMRGRKLGRTRMRGYGGSDKMEGNEIRGRNLGRTRMRRNLHGKRDDGDVFDLSLQGDGRYGFSGRNDDDNDNNSV